ncbi:hypothetical protein GCM10014715_14020 [Streptomyces spiralis]|uniref:Uncharacterized protein n=1 Tax=Streptomyces spiralis TaxID=66376 RepID=A0A919DP54_9ACTN|nr:hypothetical protein GCM10014715_14020 [Streptomyces spiralis]
MLSDRVAGSASATRAAASGARVRADGRRLSVDPADRSIKVMTALVRDIAERSYDTVVAVGAGA